MSYENCEKHISRHPALSLFKAILHKEILPEKILKDIETEKTSFMASIHHNGMLFGLLLGFGEHNSMLYGKSISTRYILKNKIKLESFCRENYPFLLVNKVQFLVDSKHPETCFLQKKYETVHDKISDIYSGKSSLEITLNELISD